ncbi:chemotaxis protein CheR [Anoxybacterium hadale]|uniref:Chemotaxis protein CheR n=1 Tax=Anoxybacterium hadale TaxID=3408580 RepID=A0ACD1AC78_9FIRM|nr:chemotaxis protein CheR [Clostridiales bacterium]
MAFTYFFRDLQTLNVVRDYALPYLKTKRYIDIWDAGCASGQEPYSLSMILNESMGHMLFRNVRILATDIDESNLFSGIIKEGSYLKDQVQRIPKEIFERYFVADQTSGRYQLKDEIKRSVSFHKHDLLSLSPPGKDFGLVVCKNVLLHFTEEQRILVLEMFYEALAEGGFLVMEQTQKLPQELKGKFEPLLSNAQLYRKK